MPKIETLVQDIQNLFKKGSNWKPDPDNVKVFGEQLAKLIAKRASQDDDTPALRFSNLGNPCDRQLYYSIKHPEDGEPLPVSAKIKFLFGDILEELLLFLAAEAGHEVKGEQTELEMEGIKGHRDAVIDGHLVDAKSASSYSFKKFKDHGLGEEGNDPFGYLVQLGSYVAASDDLEDNKTGSFLAIDKQLGHITLDTYEVQDKEFYKKLIQKKKAILNHHKEPHRSIQPVPEGKSGNMKLGVQCSYCSFKHKCYPNLRTFLYSSGPVYLTEVRKEPRVPEVTNERTF